MSWISALSDATAIERIYAGEIPELRKCCVRQLAFRRDGPQVSVQLDLPAYPSAPPAKWRAQKFNTVQLEITFVGARNIKLQGFGRDIIADVEMSLLAGGLEVAIESDDLCLHLAADAAILSRISAYLNA